MTVNEKLISEIKQGSEDAFKAIYNIYWQKVYRFTKLYLTDSYEQEDIVQQVFIKLWEIRITLDENKDIDGLLFIITRNLIFNHTRKSLNKKEFEKTLLLAEEDTYDIEKQIGADDLSEYIDKLVTLLPPRQRETFLLSRKKGLSNKEIAEILSISEKGVERSIYLALKFLKKNIPLFVIYCIG